jgi:hypothetical protein
MRTQVIIKKTESLDQYAHFDSFFIGSWLTHQSNENLYVKIGEHVVMRVDTGEHVAVAIFSNRWRQVKKVEVTYEL